MLKTLHVRTTFGRSDVVSRGRRPRWRNVSWHRMEAPWTEGRQCLSKSRDMNLTGPEAKQTRSTPMCFAPRKSECSAGNQKVSNNSLLLGMKLIAHCWITMDCWLAQVKSQQTRKLWELKTPGLGSWTLRTYLPPRIYLLMNLLYSIRFYLFLIYVILVYLILFFLILFILCDFILSYLRSSYRSVFYLNLCHFILSYVNLSYLIWICSFFCIQPCCQTATVFFRSCSWALRSKFQWLPRHRSVGGVDCHGPRREQRRALGDPWILANYHRET